MAGGLMVTVDLRTLDAEVVGIAAAIRACPAKDRAKLTAELASLLMDERSVSVDWTPGIVHAALASGVVDWAARNGLASITPRGEGRVS